MVGGGGGDLETCCLIHKVPGYSLAFSPTIYLADIDWAPAVCWTRREKFFERRMKTFQIEVIELLGILMLEVDIEGL